MIEKYSFGSIITALVTGLLALFVSGCSGGVGGVLQHLWQMQGLT